MTDGPIPAILGGSEFVINGPLETRVDFGPTGQLRWSKEGKLQQSWLIEIRKADSVSGLLFPPQSIEREYEWRDVPTEGEE